MQRANIRLISRTAALSVLSVLVMAVSARDPEGEPSTLHLSGNISVTNNGFSLIPSFSLGKPATIAVLSAGGERFSFDPQIRFDLEGLKPWSFIFIWRYKLVQTDRWLVRPGLHFPALSFSEASYESGGVMLERSVPVRFFTPEWTTTWRVADNISVGVYYLYGLGMEKEGQTRHTHFLSFRAGFSRIGLPGNLFFSWDPQIYYLFMDGRKGYYVAHSLSLGHRKLPVSISTMMNKALESEIPYKDFDWNISLVYSFSNQFVKQ